MAITPRLKGTGSRPYWMVQLGDGTWLWRRTVPSDPDDGWLRTTWYQCGQEHEAVQWASRDGGSTCWFCGQDTELNMDYGERVA